MDIVQIKDEFKNSNTLLVVLGALLIPVTHSVDSLLIALYKIAGLSFKSVLITSISFHTLLIVGVLIVLYWIISNQKSRQTKITLSHRALKSWGIISLAIILSGAAVSVYLKLYSNNLQSISTVTNEGMTIQEVSNLATIQGSLITTRTILLFILYFVLVFKRKSD